MTDFRLSVLDQAPISEGSTGADALHHSLDLAQLADELGYHRYWVAEHHGTPMLACASPEALIGPIASTTQHIRVGSGGVMLPHCSPLKVAETFSMLSALFPGRIDLGLGRAAGTDPTTAFALQRDRRQAAPDDFPQQLAELLAYLSETMPADHPFARLQALPGRPERPEPWLLGSSAQSGIWAAELGLPYAFADFISPTGAEIAQRYRREFTPSIWGREPRVIVAVWVICAETDEEAERLASSSAMSFALLHQGKLIAVPPVETALRFLEEQHARAQEGGSPGAGAAAARPLGVLPRARRKIVGAPDTVRRGIETVASDYGAEEVMVVTITYEHAARRRSYELIAEAFGLSRPERPRSASPRRSSRPLETHPAE